MNVYIVGRGENADIKVNDPSVSGRHIRLSLQEGKWMVEDLQSTNGTFLVKEVGKVKINRSVLNESDELMLGHYRASLATLLASVVVDVPKSENKPGAVYSRYVRAGDGSYEKRAKK
jgi:pSer/pThr/pTyr-binding forkhead associated (FHA) protein